MTMSAASTGTIEYRQQEMAAAATALRLRELDGCFFGLFEGAQIEIDPFANTISVWTDQISSAASVDVGLWRFEDGFEISGHRGMALAWLDAETRSLLLEL